MQIINLKNTTKAEIIQKTVEALNAGGLVIFPTETTYGAGVDATNQQAVDKLLSYKARREGKPLSIMVIDESMAREYVEVNEQAKAIYKQFLPGPITVVSKSLGKVAKGVESEFGTLGIRIPDYQLMLDISKAFGKPITATSANASDGKRPYSWRDIVDGLSKKQLDIVDLFLDAGELPRNEPSTVIDTTLSTPITVRTGELKLTEDAKNTEEIVKLISSNEAETKKIAGTLLLSKWNYIREKGLVIALEGDMGVGKTIFAKGVAGFLKITDNIKSPTYTYIEEYDYVRHQTTGKFYHLDMWKVEDQASFDRLEVEKLLKPNNVIVIEWFSQIEKYCKFEKMLQVFISENLDGTREIKYRNHE